MGRHIGLDDKNGIAIYESAELLLDNEGTDKFRQQTSNFGKFLTKYEVKECFLTIHESEKPYADCNYTIRLNPPMNQYHPLFQDANKDSQFIKDENSNELVLKTNSELFLRYIIKEFSLVRQNCDEDQKNNLINTKEYLGIDLTDQNKIIVNVKESPAYIEKMINKENFSDRVTHIEYSFKYETMSHSVVMKFLKNDGSYIKNYEFYKKDIEEKWDSLDRECELGFAHNFESVRKQWLQYLVDLKPSYKIV